MILEVFRMNEITKGNYRGWREDSRGQNLEESYSILGENTVVEKS